MDELTKARAQRALDTGTGNDPAGVARYILDDMIAQDPPPAAFLVIGVWREDKRITRTSIGRAGIPPYEAVGVFERAKLVTFLDEIEDADEEEG